MPTWGEIDAMSPEQVAAKFDRGVQNVSPGVGFWADMLVYKATMANARVQGEQNARMVELTASIEELTRKLRWLAALSLVASIVAVAVAVTTC